VTITIDKATLELIRRKVGPRGVSKFIADAARDHAARNELLDYLRELDERYGPVPPEVYAKTDRELRKHFGMPPPKVPWDGTNHVLAETTTRTHAKRSRRRATTTPARSRSTRSSTRSSR